jgi:hypothetical protein
MQQATARQSLEKEKRQCIEIFPQKNLHISKKVLNFAPA